MYTFWVTSNCNLSCKYCYEGKEKANSSMTRSIVDRAIGFVLNHYESNGNGELIISIHGGEPLLEFEIIKYMVSEMKKQCAEKNISVSFVTTTNATLLNDEIIEFLEKEIPDVTVSIDGRKETHDQMRPYIGGQGSHDKVLKNSLKLLKVLPNIRLRMTFDSDTVHTLYEDARYLVDCGFKLIVPAPNLFDEKWDTKHLHILEEQIALIKNYIKDKDQVEVSIAGKNEYFVKGKCSGGKTGFHIYPDGRIFPCMIATGTEEFCIGDIFNGINIEKRDYLLQFSDQENPDCIGCSLYKSCDGVRCKIKNKLITGNYNKPPLMHCALENLKYRVN